MYCLQDLECLVLLMLHVMQFHSVNWLLQLAHMQSSFLLARAWRYGKVAFQGWRAPTITMEVAEV